VLRLHLGRPWSRSSSTPAAPLRAAERPQQRWLLPALFLLVALSTASDRLFLAWFVGPILAIEALLLVRRLLPAAARRRLLPTTLPAGSGRIVAATAAGALGGILLHGLVTRPSGNYRPDLSPDVALTTRARRLLDVFSRSELTTYWPYYSLACLAAALVLVVLWWRRRHDPSWFLFGLWFGLGGLAALFAQFLTAGPGWRFHQFLYHVPILMVGVWLPQLLGRVRLSAAPVAVAGSVAVVAAGALPVDELSTEHVPPGVTCLDRTIAASGSRVGVGKYAVSRLAVVYSEHELDVGTRNTWMAPEEDVHSRAWARDSADFAILRPTIFGTIPERTLRSLAERAPVEVACGTWRVLDFGPGGLDLGRLAPVGGRAETPGCWYTGSIGVADPPGVDGQPGRSCSLRVEPDQTDPDVGTYVGFGSYYAVDPGRYQLTADLGPGPVPDGVFEVAVWDANSGELQAVETASLSELAIVIDTATPDRELSLEGRILYRGGAPLVLERLAIERID
ncbi:MAG: hypothetical protein OEV40_25800, partial [Acidimicrobiia bacterium]|nr:hypothetical protein [Acidimicrobiia bacterium]